MQLVIPEHPMRLLPSCNGCQEREARYAGTLRLLEQAKQDNEVLRSRNKELKRQVDNLRRELIQSKNTRRKCCNH